MEAIVIRQATIVNEGKKYTADVLVRKGLIDRIGENLQVPEGVKEINAEGKYLLPGLIDDQVHFREPGLTHKGEIATESRAAVAGGITSFMEMPNTIPNVFTQKLLEEKYRIAANRSLANYSFFMGASNDNLEEVLKTDARKVCGIKVFMGSSTGNMLVDSAATLEGIFSRSPMLIATHCEDEATIRANMEQFKNQYGENMDISMHPLIRNVEACYKSSSLAVELAERYGSRLHVLHISTAKEIELFRNDIPLSEKKITAEACVHHIWFDDSDYARLGNKIKWNPAIKSADDKKAILQGLLSGKIDILATDHAPHTIEEKAQPYLKAPSGGPLVQHSLVAMLELVHQGLLSIEQVVDKMAHAPSVCFKVQRRGFIREGYFADLVLVDLNAPWTVSPENILYKCGWSPFEGTTFKSKITHTLVNGVIVYENGNLVENNAAMRMTFDN